MQIVLVQVIHERVPSVLALPNGLFEILSKLPLINQVSLETPHESPIRNHKHDLNAIFAEISILPG